MSLLPIYFNEISLPSRGLRRQELVDCVVRMIAALRAISKISEEVVLGSRESLATLGLSEDYQNLASLTSEIDRDWWRIFKSFENRSPFAEVPHSINPEPDEEMDIGGCVSEGALWAHRNATLMLSFPWLGDFTKDEVEGVLRKLGVADVSKLNVRIRQVSTVETVKTWQNFVENYGVEEAASSLIFEDHVVSLRMYLNDHEPPHVHVFLHDAPRKCRAKIRFDEVEYLKSTLPAGVSSHVIDLVRRHRDELQAGWERCRDGRLPLRLVAG